MSQQDNNVQTIVIQKESNTSGVIALILGIIGVIVGFIPYIGWFMAPVWLLAIIFGAIGMRKKHKRGLALTGLILGFLGAVYKIGFWIFVAGGFIAASSNDVEGSSLIKSEVPNSSEISSNIYNKSDLHPETVKLLDDPNYQNVILPEELEQKLSNNEAVMVYFYSPTCPGCLKTTPILSTLEEEMGINFVQYNLLEFEQGWDDFDIETTPSLVYFEEGKEVKRIEGDKSEEEFRAFLEQQSVITIPSVKDSDIDSVKSLFEQNGIIIGEIIQMEDESIPEGHVIRTEPEEGSEIEPGSKVDIYQSSGRPAKELILKDMDTGEDVVIINGRRDQIFLYVYFSYSGPKPDEPHVMDELNENIDKFIEAGIEVIGIINQGTTYEDKQIIKNRNWQIPVYLDKDGVYSNEHSIFFTPDISVEDGTGKVITDDLSGSDFFFDTIKVEDVVNEILDKVKINN